jgi:hypothetical protein
MQKFKDGNNKIYQFESIAEMQDCAAKNIGPFKRGLKESDLTVIDEAEAYEILNPPLTPEQQLEKLINEATTVVESMIQAVIDQYNAAHKVKFANADALPKYTRNPQYPHFQFCSEVLDWITSEEIGVGIWETARDIQEKVLTGEIEAPANAEEFAAMLPAYAGVI